MSVNFRRLAGVACLLCLGTWSHAGDDDTLDRAPKIEAQTPEDLTLLMAEVEALTLDIAHRRYGKPDAAGSAQALEHLHLLDARLRDFGPDGARGRDALRLLEADVQTLVQSAALAGTSKALAPGPTMGTGSFTGTITDAQTRAVLPNVLVQIYNCAGRWAASTRTDATGRYSTPATLDAGVYLARTVNETGYVDQLYRGKDCIGSCEVLTGTPIVVSSGPVRLDFALRRGGRISGTVRDASGLGLPAVNVDIYDALGNLVTSGSTSSSGSFTSPSGLLRGVYYARTSNSAGFADELYDNFACLLGRCDPARGTAISVTFGLTTSGVNFVLAGAHPLPDPSPGEPPPPADGHGGRISGRVTDAVTGAPVAGEVWIYNAAGWRVTSATTDATGAYTSGAGLPTGDYYVGTYARSSDNYVNELFDDIACTGCDPRTGLAIHVDAGFTTSGIDFALRHGGTIYGTVRDALTLAPIAGGNVTVYSSASRYVGSYDTDAAGTFSARGLATGSYRVTARGPARAGYLAETYRSSGGSDLVSVGVPGITTISIGLHKGGRIAGTIVDAATGITRQGTALDVYGPGWSYAGSGKSDCSVNGMYSVPDDGLAAGTYRIVARSPRSHPYPYGYRSQLYKQLDCGPYCDVGSGEPVVVSVGATTTGKDFRLVRQLRNSDYDRDGRSDIAVFETDTGQWLILLADLTTVTTTLGGPTVLPVPNDYDGDGETDAAVYDPAAGRWTIRRSSSGTDRTIALGALGDVPVRGDFDGDGKADPAVYNPSSGVWSIRYSTTLTTDTVTLGGGWRVAAPADYDGDGQTDLAVFDPATGTWTVRYSHAGAIFALTPTLRGTIPVSGDFDGDGRADLALYDASTRLWWVQNSYDGSIKNFVVGSAAGTPLTLDYDGDGKTDAALYEAGGNWTVRRSSNETEVSIARGAPGYVPLD